MIVNIIMICTEYRQSSDKWGKVSSSSSVTDSNMICSMLNAQPYLLQMGGKVFNKYRVSKKLGKVVSLIDTISSDGTIRRRYEFKYGRASVLNDGSNKDYKAKRGISLLSENYGTV